MEPETFKEQLQKIKTKKAKYIEVTMKKEPHITGLMFYEETNGVKVKDYSYSSTKPYIFISKQCNVDYEQACSGTVRIKDIERLRPITNKEWEKIIFIANIL